MKTAIRISRVVEITDKRVKVILAESGKEIWLPLSQAERFGDRVFIPTWLARRYNQLKSTIANHQSTIQKGGQYARHDRQNKPSQNRHEA